MGDRTLTTSIPIPSRSGSRTSAACPDSQSFTLTVSADTEAPSVVILQTTNLTNPGNEVTFQVLAADNVAVASRTLTIDGVPLTLDADGIVTITAATSGLKRLVATATDPSGNVGTAEATLRVFDAADNAAPVVQITSPLFGDLVTSLTQVTGTVTDANLEFYRVEYAPVSTNQFVTFAEGTSPVVNGVLGTFDSTLLDNGEYTIRVMAQDVNGQQTFQQINVGVEGQLKLGNFRQEFTDLVLPLAGIPITITRVYDSLQADVAGDFGFGWSLDFGYNPRIRETVPVTGNFFGQTPFKMGTRVYLTTPDGRRVGFTFAPVPEPGLLGTIWRPRFRPDPGVFDTLEVDPITLSQRPDGTFGLYLFGFAYNPDSYTLTTKDGTKYRYNQFSGLQTITDRNNNVLTFTRDGIFSSLGESIAFIRDVDGRIKQIIDPAGNPIEYRYDAAGNLAGAKNQVGQEETYLYEALGRPHYLTAIHSVCGCFTSLRIEYDDQGRLIGISNALNQTGQFSYDLENFTETMTDPLLRVTTLVYDARGNILSRTDPLNHTMTFTYDANDNQTSVTDANEHTVELAYDGRGNITSMTDAKDNVTTITYNAFSQPTTITDLRSGVWTNVYDDRGNPIRQIDAAELITVQTFDAAGRITSRTDPELRTVTFVYETALQLPTRTIYPDSTVRVTRYNDFGELTEEIDPLTHSRLYTYDDAGKLLTIRDANGRETSFAYDTNDRLASVTDPDQNVTQYQYDAADRRTAEITATGTRTWVYNAASELVREEDRNGRVREYRYDLAGRLEHEDWLEPVSLGILSVPPAPPNTVNYSYDPAGNVIEVWDNFSHYSFAYDERDFLTEVDNAGTPDVPHVVLTYNYDDTGNLLEVEDDRGTRVVSQYDARNLLTRFEWQGAGFGTAVVSLAYDDAGDVTRLDRFNNGAAAGHSELVYDEVGNMVRLTHRSASDAVFADYQYDYDDAARLSEEVRSNQTAAYGYDDEGQLTSADYTGQGDESYTYDQAGNRTGAGVVIGPHNRLMADGTFTYEYDDEGNLIEKTEVATGQVTEFVWDHRNRLVAVEVRSAGGIVLTAVEYRYDATDRRIARVVNGQAMYTVYDGENAWVDFDASGSEAARYLQGDDYDFLLARWRPQDGLAWYLVDQLGTVRDVTDGAGLTVVNHIEYDAFGQVLSQSNAAAGDRFLFTGREYEPELALYYYRARYYDPQTGRFISQDPISFDSGDYNLYRYVANDPITSRDPLGLATTVSYGTLLRRVKALQAKVLQCLGKSAAARFFEMGVYLLVDMVAGVPTVYAGGAYQQTIAARIAERAAWVNKQLPIALSKLTTAERKQVEQYLINKLREMFRGTNVRVLNNRNPWRRPFTFKKILNCK